MKNQFSRTEMLFGKDKMARLYTAKVAVFGVGGVGGAATEALARSGIGRLDLFDNDVVCVTNINRQIYATMKTIGLFKADAAKERILEINPEAEVNAFKLFYMAETSGQVDLSQYDYIIDAIDTVSGKIELVIRAQELGIPLISSMGAGNKVDAAAFRVADIYDTTACPLAKVMRHELRKRGIPGLKVVYSTERPLKPNSFEAEEEETSRKRLPGSNAFVPPACGLIIAGEVVKDLMGYKNE